MSKRIRTKSKGVQRSDIPYKDRLMVGQFANIAQRRDHSALVANKIGEEVPEKQGAESGQLVGSVRRRVSDCCHSPGESEPEDDPEGGFENG